MDLQEQYNWTVIYTDHNKQFIHIDYLRKNNPNAQILLADTSNKFTKNFAWRNGDLLVREWLKYNYDKILHNNIAILEWDVLVNTTLPSFEVKGLIVKDKHIYSRKNRWHWFRERKLLENYRKYSMGISPFGVLLMEKKCINILLDNEFDNLFRKNIQAELRLPTILNSKRIPIFKRSMPHVSNLPVIFTNKNTIYHPIKSKIA